MAHENMNIRAEMNIVDKGSLVAIGDVFLDEMIVIHEVKVVTKQEKDGKTSEFVSFPSRKKDDGWEKIVKVRDPDLRERISSAVLAATNLAREKDMSLPSLKAEIRLYDKGDTKAYATVTYADAVQIENVRICEKDGKLSVFYPFEKNGDYYQNLAGPATLYMKRSAEKTILEAYEAKARVQRSVDMVEEHEREKAREVAERSR